MVNDDLIVNYYDTNFSRNHSQEKCIVHELR